MLRILLSILLEGVGLAKVEVLPMVKYAGEWREEG